MELVQRRRNVVVGNIYHGLGRLFELCCRIGISGAVGYAVKVRARAALRHFGFDSEPKHILVKTKDARYPLRARYLSSDLDVFEQSFVTKEYAPLDNMNEPKLIIDCGANVGYSSVWFLNRFRNVHVVAVEPDARNFLVRKENLQPYGARAVARNLAVWPRSTGLRISEGTRKEGEEWAIEVPECNGEEKPDVAAMDISTILSESGFSEIDLLKIDIERSERFLFAENCQEWLDKVHNLAIELHDEECKSVFSSAMQAYSFDLQRHRELTICRNVKRKDG